MSLLLSLSCSLSLFLGCLLRSLTASHCLPSLGWPQFALALALD